MKPTEEFPYNEIEANIGPRHQYMFRIILLALIDHSHSVLNGNECYVLKGLVNGKSYREISEELQFTVERIRQICKVANEKLYDHVRSNELLKENWKLRMENKMLYEEVQRLQAAQSGAANQADSQGEQPKSSTHTRSLQGTSFDRKIYEIGLSYVCSKPLMENGIITIGDLVKLNKIDIVKMLRIRYDVCEEIEEKLKALGLHLGMDLDNMSEAMFVDYQKKLTFTLDMKPGYKVFKEDKAYLSSAATHVLEEVIGMAPKFGIILSSFNMSALTFALKSSSYNELARNLGCSPDEVRKAALEAIEELKIIPEYLNLQMKNIASSPEKESQPYVGELSEKIRLILNTQLKDIPFSSKNGAIAVLEKIGIMTVGDLCSRHRSEIEAIPSIRSRMNFVDKILSDLGLTYGMTLS